MNENIINDEILILIFIGISIIIIWWGACDIYLHKKLKEDDKNEMSYTQNSNDNL